MIPANVRKDSSLPRIIYKEGGDMYWRAAQWSICQGPRMSPLPTEDARLSHLILGRAPRRSRDQLFCSSFSLTHTDGRSADHSSRKSMCLHVQASGAHIAGHWRKQHAQGAKPWTGLVLGENGGMDRGSRDNKKGLWENVTRLAWGLGWRFKKGYKTRAPGKRQFLRRYLKKMRHCRETKRYEQEAS